MTKKSQIIESFIVLRNFQKMFSNAVSDVLKKKIVPLSNQLLLLRKEKSTK